MTKKMPARPGGSRVTLGLAAGFLTLALAGCSEGFSPTEPGQVAAPGQCRVTCSDYSTSLYVAIAVSPSALVCGSAANLTTVAAAKKQAVLACGREDCTPVVWGHSGVAAVAVDRLAYGWGWAPNAESTADAKAIASCESRTP